MLKLKFLIVFIAPFLLYPNTVNAQWSKNQNNPISPTNIVNASTPDVIAVNEDLNIYYSKLNNNGWNIQLSTITPDGEWTPPHTNIISVGSNDGWEKEISDPSIIKHGNEYFMFYTSINTDHWTQGPDRFRTRRARSLDGINWSLDNNWVLSGTPGKWDSGGTARGRSVIFNNNQFHMWYAATNENSLVTNPQWRIGYAISSDGMNWQKQNNGLPVITPSNIWESNNVSYPNVIHENGKYKMFYASGPGDLPNKIVYAESTDGINWIKPASMNPVLSTSIGFDSHYIADPSVLKVGNEYRMYYAGYNGSRWSIGLATKPANMNSVPLIKQTSEPWQSNEYDRATRWSPNNTTINRWGCALTSAAMVFQYHGYAKLPDGSLLDPGSLNEWLNSQRDGYIGNGLVNWNALSRLSKKARDVNTITSFSALEYRRAGVNNQLLDNDLSNNRPVILKQPGHFVVATNKSNNTYSINDPFYDRESLQEYNNSYLSLNRFIPSNTDLSTILITAPASTNLIMRDSEGNIAGESFIESPLLAADDPSVSSGEDIKVYMLTQPNTGTFTLEVNGNEGQILDIESYLYDKDGEVQVTPFSIFATNTPGIIQISFNKDANNETSIIKSINYESILSELEIAKKYDLIQNSLYSPVEALIKNSRKQYEKDRIVYAKGLLYIAKKLIIHKNEDHIDEDYSNILTNDLEILQSSL